MPSSKIHRLLGRQLKKFFGDSFSVPVKWRGFIDAVNSAYHESDMDRNMLERSLELSSQELLQTNSEMRAIFEAVPDIFFRIDASGKILDCKAGSTTPDLFISRSNMIGRAIDDIPVASVASLFRKAVLDVRQTKAPVTIEYSLWRRQTEFFYEARWIPVEEDQIVIVIRNITDRKFAENALRKSEEYYRELTANSSDVLYVVDKTGIIQYASPSVERVTGYRPDELIGKNSLSLIAPADHAKAVLDFRQALATRDVSIPNSFRLLHKNGTEMIMEGLGKNLLHHPVIAGFVMNVRDVTERRKTQDALQKREQQYRQLAEMAHDLIIAVDLDFKITFVNKAVLSLSGGLDLVGSSLLDFTPTHLHAMQWEIMKKRQEGYDEMLSFEYELVLPGGEMKIFDIRGTLITENDQPSGVLFIARDATQRRRAEEALQESEKKYRLLTEKMTDIVWTADMNLRTTYVTPSIYPVLGFTQEERMEQTVDEQFTPESLVRVMDALAREFPRDEQGNADPDIKATLVLEYYHKDGSTRWMETVMSGLRDDQGKLTGLHGVSRDITERKKTEEKLRQSEELYTRLVDTMPDVIVRTDLAGNILFVNDYAFQINGYRRDEIEGQNILRFIAPEDHQSAVEDLMHMMEGNIVPHEYNLLAKDGRKIPFEINGNVLRNEEGVPFGVVVVGRNLSERKQSEGIIRKSEERYRTIFESTATANMILAEDTTILMANNNFALLSGYSKQEIEGKLSWTMFVHPDDLERMISYHLARRMHGGSAPASYEFRFLNRAGEIKEMFISVAVIPGTRENIVSLVDLTERKQLETQLLQAQKMESVGRLAGGVAHDFNNMLSVIIGNTEMAMNKMRPSEPLYKTLQDVLNARLRSADLTRQLLAFARQQTISPKILDLNDTLAGMLKMLQRLIGENIDLGWHPGHNLWQVKIDPSQVDQLLANLAVNARDAIHQSGRITIETSNVICDDVYCADRPECVPGDYVMLAVSDNGYGMSKETLTMIFEPFFMTNNEGQGTGLGLATVYGIVKQNNGFINVYSEPGVGTTFKIYLPRNTEHDDAPEDKKIETDLPGGNETILIVEDEITVLSLTQAMLEALGYNVLAAGNKDLAFHLVQNHAGAIDLLLTDIVMPDINGKELAERMAHLKPGMKCLYMSGYTADVIARQGILEEGIHFISKPFSLRDLANKIRAVLEA